VKVAHFINSRGGQQLVNSATSFSTFRDLLKDEVKRLREFLSDYRLKSIANAMDAINQASLAHKVSTLTNAITDEAVVGEVEVQQAGVETLLDMVEGHVDNVVQSMQPGEAGARSVLAGVQEAFPQNAQICKMAVEAIAIIDAAEWISSCKNLSALTAAVNEGALSLMLLWLRKLQEIFDSGPVELFEVETVEDLKKTIVKMTDMQSALPAEGQEESHSQLDKLLGKVEVAEWLTNTDNQGEGFLRKYLIKLYDNGITSLKEAKNEIIESGDLRQYQVDRAPAKALFAALQEY
jgi:hypothetical protein